MALQAINPATGEAVAAYDELSAEAVQGIIADTHQAYLRWRATSFPERATLMRDAAEVLRGNAREYARLMAAEMGKPIRHGIAEVRKSPAGSATNRDPPDRFWRPGPCTTEAGRAS